MAPGLRGAAGVPQFRAEDVLGTLRVQVPEFAGTVLPCLVNALAALTAPVVLVLDDYHVITERACHQQLNFLLRTCRRRSSWC